MTFNYQIRKILLVVVLLVCGIVAYYLLRPADYFFQAKNISLLGSDADMMIEKMHVVQNKKGEKTWEMWADSAKMYHKKKLTKLEAIYIRFYPKNGKRMDLRADRGLMETGTRNMNVFGNVLIETFDGFSLRTDRLRFMPETNHIDTDARISVKGKSYNLTGVGLHGRTDLGRFSLKNKVEAVIHNTSGRNFPNPSEQASALPPSPSEILQQGGTAP